MPPKSTDPPKDGSPRREEDKSSSGRRELGQDERVERESRPRDDRERESRRDDRERESRPRDDRERESRPRDDRERESRPRDDRGGRESRPRDDRGRESRRDDRGERESRPRDDRGEKLEIRQEDRGERESRPRDDRGGRESRPRDDRGRESHPRDDRGGRESRPRDDRGGRESRPRDDRGETGSRPRDDRERSSRPRESRPRESRPRSRSPRSRTSQSSSQSPRRKVPRSKKESKGEPDERKREQVEPLPHPSRPGLGKSGRTILMDANMFKLKFEGVTTFQYDVKIIPELKSRQLHRKFFLYAMEHCDELKGSYAVYDGRSLMYSHRPIQAKEWPLKFNLSEADVEDKSDRTQPKSRKPPKVYSIHMTPSSQGRGTGQLDMTIIDHYLRGDTKELPRTALQALDVVTRYYTNILRHPIGRSIFYPDENKYQRSITGGAMLWFGHYQTVRATQLGLVLNVDLSATVVLEDCGLLEYVCSRLGRKSPNDIRLPRDNPAILRAVRGVQIEITHRGSTRRKYRIADLAKVPANQDCFERDGKQVSVAKYFAEKYGKPLKYPQFPCVTVGVQKPISLPMEVCKVAKGQRQRHALNGLQRQKMIDATCLDPNARFQNILDGCPDDSKDPYLKEFRIAVDKKMARIQGRLLDAPTLMMKDERSKRDRIVTPYNGTWSLKDLSFREGASVTNCPVLLFANERDMPTATARSWMTKLIEVAKYKGMGWSSKIELTRVVPQPAKVKDIFTELARSRDPPVIIFCFLLTNKEPIYRHIKKQCETLAGIPTQCVDWSKATHPRTGGAAYQANIALKMNAKLGGSNNVISPALPLVSEKPTLVMGADVHHPAVGNKSSPSIAAVVGSYNSWASKYITVVQEQGHRIEYICEMEAAVKSILLRFYEECKMYPEQIIMYRDGVGEGGFDEIVAREVKAIYNACASVKSGYKAKVTFLIVQKRNHVRLFPVDEKNADKDGRLLPGTVVDQGICSPYDFDFFLCSHSGLKGTSKPTHYHVLWDENKLDPDKLLELTYSLCHVYARCARSVSIPAPAYYAHLAAYRARLYSEEAEDDASESGASQSIPGVSPNLKHVLYYV